MEVNSLLPLNRILNNINKLSKNGRPVELLAVTKNQPIEKIISLLNEGQRLFGENKVQEAYSKWPSLKEQYPELKLHLIGHLQSNKTREAVALFDVIQSLDSLKLAKKLQEEELKQNKHLEYYIEINIGNEDQKSGVLPENFDEFYTSVCANSILNVIGIMCIPPANQNPIQYFKKMLEYANRYSIKNISMGMSDDYELAIENGSTLVRIGRALFE